MATVDDCARFQSEALRLPKNWRQQPKQADKEVGFLSSNTVLKWSRALQAAFERVNRNATRRKCVRGVVEENKLLASNPWPHFTWIEGKKRLVRQFDGEELLSLLSFLETSWGGVPIATAAAKVFLWSGCRKLEVAGLTWDSLRVAGSEYHFEIIDKWGVEKWFRLPESVYRELLGFRTNSRFVFAAYVDQLRQFHAHNPNWLRNIGGDFKQQSDRRIGIL